MNPIILPAPATPTREQLEYYRDQKLLNRRLAHNIDMLQHSRYVTGTRMMQIDRLVADLAAREAALSPLGNRICIALMRIPDIVDQTAVELRYLDLLSYRDRAGVLLNYCPSSDPSGNALYGSSLAITQQRGTTRRRSRARLLLLVVLLRRRITLLVATAQFHHHNIVQGQQRMVTAAGPG